MRSIEEVDSLIERDLPAEINGFKRRIGTYRDFETLIYSKDGGFLAKYIDGRNANDLEHFASGMLYEVIGKNLEECYEKAKLKISLNEKVKADFPTNIIFDFKPNFLVSNGEDKFYIKLFEVYLVLDTNSDSQFFCVVSLNPAFDIHYLFPVLKQLNNQIREDNFIKLSGEEFNYSDFSLPKAVHFYSVDFSKEKDQYRKLFKGQNWNVKFRDKYFFDKALSINQKKIILCEGKNVIMLNQLGIEDILFSDELNSVAIFQNVKTRQRYCLRDKDYLLREEIESLQAEFPKYYILAYYCIENYLYHPENINELELENFNTEAYIKDITKQKNDCFLEIVRTFEGIRKGYKELSENHIKRIRNSGEILTNELKSDEFEVFYQHYDMKKKYKKDFLSKYQLTETKLSQTDWFKEKIKKIISTESSRRLTLPK